MDRAGGTTTNIKRCVITATHQGLDRACKALDGYLWAMWTMIPTHKHAISDRSDFRRKIPVSFLQ